MANLRFEGRIIEIAGGDGAPVSFWTYPGSGTVIMSDACLGTKLTPDQARELAAGLVNLAAVAEIPVDIKAPPAPEEAQPQTPPQIS